MSDVLYRNSANLLIVERLVDWYERDATGNPTPVTNPVSVTGRIYAPDQITPLSAEILLTQEADQLQNYFRGIAPKTVDFGTYTEVAVKFTVNGGGDFSYSERWKFCKVVSE